MLADRQDQEQESGVGLPIAEPLLQVRDLQVAFIGKGQSTPAVRGISYELRAGEVLGLVGESGSGKSVSALAIIGLLPPPDRCVARGSITLGGQELLGLSDSDLRHVRGSRIGMVFQDPLSNLNPVLTIGRQITEGISAHTSLRGSAAAGRAAELLDLVGIADPRRRLREYPHQLSGGMRQRAMIAMALSCEPQLLIADEPTTALDVTIQAQVLELLQSLQRQLGMAMLLITHDLGVVAGVANRVAVMYTGRLVEVGPTAQILGSPSHPYSVGLLRSLPRIDQPKPDQLRPIPGLPPDPSLEIVGCAFEPRCNWRIQACAIESPQLIPMPARPGHDVACFNRPTEEEAVAGQPVGYQPLLERPAARQLKVVSVGAERLRVASQDPILSVQSLTVQFALRRGPLRRRYGWNRAVDDVSLVLRHGMTLGLVGESGSGKSTLGRAVLRLVEPEHGQILLNGERITALRGGSLRRRRRKFQMVFQDPYASLDPRQTVGAIIEEPLRIHSLPVSGTRSDRLRELLGMVGLDARLSGRYPHELSGGQRQRVGIARALAVEPELIVCDEPISSLDVSIRAQIINLLVSLQVELGVAYLFIAHDMAVVRQVADEVAVMYLGQIVESGPMEELLRNPRHPYTVALLSSVPIPDAQAQESRRRIILSGDLPLMPPTEACRFAPRCWLREQLGNPDACITSRPNLTPARSANSGHVAACHFADEVAAAADVRNDISSQA